MGQASRTASRALPQADSSNFYDFGQITKDNVHRLEVAWSYPHGAMMFSPIVVDGVVYGLGRNNSALVALDATTGKEIWVHDGLEGITSKGINYWESEDGKDRRLIFAVNSFLQAIDARTGKSILTFGTNGVVDLRQGLARAEGTATRAMPASPGRIWRNVLVLGGQSGEAFITPPGDIRAYDVVTGRRLWQFHVVPLPGEFGYETNPKDGYKYIGGANNWGELSLDDERGIVYIPTGSATYDFYGADRHGANLFANCLLALDVRTGRRLWHFQTIHHDLWDLDNVSAPQLVTVTHNGRRIDAVAHAGKTGFLYVFDRVTGDPLWPIEERPVPKTDVPGEYSSPTQPFPTKPAPFVKQSFTVDDVNPWLLTPEEYQDVRARVANARNGAGPQGGLFIPPAVNEESVSMPGNQGGSNWGTTAANPDKGYVFVVGVNQVALLRLEDVKTRKAEPGGGRGRGAGPGEVLPPGPVVATGGAPQPPLPPPPTSPAYPGIGGNAGSIPWPDGMDLSTLPPTRYMSGYNVMATATRPPYTTITAYDLNTGEIKWQVAPGDDAATVAAGGPRGTGAVRGRNGLLVTRTGLVFHLAGDGKVRAYDEETGKELWAGTAHAGSQRGMPVMYLANGRQYLLVMSQPGGEGGGSTPVPDVPPTTPRGYIVFALPR
jgi:quinoprotein glucose dehydrogenase